MTSCARCVRPSDSHTAGRRDVSHEVVLTRAALLTRLHLRPVRSASGGFTATTARVHNSDLSNRCRDEWTALSRALARSQSVRTAGSGAHWTRL